MDVFGVEVQCEGTEEQEADAGSGQQEEVASSSGEGSSSSSSTSASSSSSDCSHRSKLDVAVDTGARASSDPAPHGGVPRAAPSASAGLRGTVHWHDFKLTPKIPLSGSVKPSWECTCRLHDAAGATRCTRTRSYTASNNTEENLVLRKLRMWALAGASVATRAEHQRTRDPSPGSVLSEQELESRAAASAADRGRSQGAEEAPALKRHCR